MMKSRLIAIASMVAVSALAASAQGDVLAGWDFSQYKGSGFLTIDGSTNTDTLPANYPTASPGNGTMLMDGTEGSDDVDENAASPDVVPVAGFRGDYDASEVPGTNGAIESNGASFDSFAALEANGQQYTTRSSLSAQATTDVVFQTSGGPGTDWDFAFGGRTYSGTSDVAVAYSPDCSGSYTPATGSPAALDASDQLFEFDIDSGSPASSYCVRLTLDAGSGRPIIDNVTLLPEPGTTAMLGIGTLGILGLSRRRRRA